MPTNAFQFYTEMQTVNLDLFSSVIRWKIHDRISLFMGGWMFALFFITEKLKIGHKRQYHHFKGILSMLVSNTLQTMHSEITLSTMGEGGIASPRNKSF